MGVFTNNLVIEVIPNAKKPFRVREEFKFHMGYKDSPAYIKCKDGFEYDGTSIPWGLRWLISTSDPDLLQCSAIHDQGFQDGFILIDRGGYEEQLPVHRDVINSLMSEAMLAKNVRKWKRVVINTGLAIGSGPTWRRYREQYNAVRTETTR